MRNRLIITIALVAAAIAVVPARSASAVSSATTTITWLGTTPPTPDNAPAIVPTVDCSIPGIAASTPTAYWFGWTMQPYFVSVPFDAPIGPTSNGFTEVKPITLGRPILVNAADDRGQPTQFRVGTFARAMAVSAAATNVLTWTVTVPGIHGGSYRVDVSPASPPRCPAGTPTQSAAVQSTVPVGIAFAGTPASPGTLIKLRSDPTTGLLSKATFRFSMATGQGLVSACSEGGTPLPPAVVWGYSDASMVLRAAGVNVLPPNNLAVVPKAERLGSETYNGETYVRTLRSDRVIKDLQLLFPVPGTIPQVVLKGLAATHVIADVVGRCQFGTTVVDSTQVMFASGGRPVLFLRDVESGAVVVPSNVFELSPWPGGVRYR